MAPINMAMVSRAKKHKAKRDAEMMHQAELESTKHAWQIVMDRHTAAMQEEINFTQAELTSTQRALDLTRGALARMQAEMRSTKAKLDRTESVLARMAKERAGATMATTIPTYSRSLAAPHTRCSMPYATASRGPTPHAPLVATGSRFLALPSELRNRIYELVLVVGQVAVEGKRRRNTPKVATHSYEANVWHTTPFNVPALLAVNRQVRKETKGIYFGRNLFLVGGLTWDRRWLPLISWLKMLGHDSRRQLRQVSTGWYLQRDFRGYHGVYSLLDDLAEIGEKTVDAGVGLTADVLGYRSWEYIHVGDGLYEYRFFSFAEIRDSPIAAGAQHEVEEIEETEE